MPTDLRHNSHPSSRTTHLWPYYVRPTCRLTSLPRPFQVLLPPVLAHNSGWRSRTRPPACSAWRQAGRHFLLLPGAIRLWSSASIYIYIFSLTGVRYLLLIKIASRAIIRICNYRPVRISLTFWRWITCRHLLSNNITLESISVL